MKYNLLKKLGSGAVGDAFLLEDKKVIIIGKREDSFSIYQTLLKKMQMIDGKITCVKYPQIYRLIEPCEDYPFGAVVEGYIGGVELQEVITKLDDLQKVEIGKVIAQFLKQIHCISVDRNKDEEININLSKYERSLALIKDYLTNDIYKKLLEIKKDYKKFMENKDFCLTHGDLNAGNIMIDEGGKVSGIIDFGNMEYYVPEIEFGHMYFFDKVIYQSMIDNYDKKINEKDIILLELVLNIRHFKNVIDFDDKRNSCINNIKYLLTK